MNVSKCPSQALHAMADIERDEPFLTYLHETILLLQDMVTPFDFIVIGIMGKDIYTQLASTAPSLAAFPRRETICAHTINQTNGAILYLPDMRLDPYLARSPFVTDHGLVSYVGTPLRLVCDGTGENVVIGTLCAVSYNTAAPALDARDHQILMRFADIMVHDIVKRARAARLAEQHRMDHVIRNLVSEAHMGNSADLVLGALQEIYPNTNVSLQHRSDDSIELRGIDQIRYEQCSNGLYEAITEVEAHIYNFNHLPDSSHPRDRTLRAVVTECPGIPHTYLVVQTSDLAHIFDDVDVDFVRSCARVLGDMHCGEINERTARAAFFRQFENSLRAPIHTILRSCEQLIEQTEPTPLAKTGLITTELERLQLLENTLKSGHALLSSVDNLLEAGTVDLQASAHCPLGSVSSSSS
jgi:hypothetical protein